MLNDKIVDTIKYEDVKHITSKEYFVEDEYACDVFDIKYCQKWAEDGSLVTDTTDTYAKIETPADVFMRVASGLAAMEDDEEQREYFKNKWFSLMWLGWFRPGGSVLSGTGSANKKSLLNCTTLPLSHDSLEAIAKLDYDIMKAAAFRQGLGFDASVLRPRGAKVNNAAEESTGAVPWINKLVMNGEWVGQCLYEDTLILTTDGDYIPIKDIIGKQIYIEGDYSSTLVINWFNNGIKDLYKVTTIYGDEIISSGDHIYKVVNKKGITDKKLKDIDIENDYLLSRRVDIEKDYVVIKNFDYKKSDYNNSNRLYIPEKMPTVFNEDLAYLCGNIYGDGNCYNDSIEIALSDSLPECTSKIDNCLYNVFGAHIGDYGFNVRKGDGAVKRLHIGKFITGFLKHLGIVKQTGGNLVFPEIIKQSPKSVVLAFFAGLFDADGHNSSTKKNIDLSLIDYEFLCELKRQLFRCGVISSVTKRRETPVGPNNKHSYKLSLVGKRSAQIVEQIGSVKLNKGNIYGKYDRLKTPFMLKDLDIKGKGKIKEVSHGQFITDLLYEKLTGERTDLYIQKISSIVNVGKGQTYDITVNNDTHMFMANNIIVSNSGRKPALLVSLKDHHPDIIEFIQAKREAGALENANISVQISDAFMEAVENDGDWELYFDFEGDVDYERISRTIKAKDLFNLIVEMSYKTAEPGVQFIDKLREGYMVHQVYKATGDERFKGISTNACSEKFLAPYGVCNLLSPNMEMFSTDEEEYKQELEYLVPFMVRLSDNVTEYELRNKLSPLKEQRWILEQVREVGLGITNIHGWLLKQDLAYDSDAAIQQVEKFFKVYACETFKASIALGKEKGSAPAWSLVKDKKHFMGSTYFRNMVNELFNGDYSEVKHMRNLAHMSIAPTGSLSSTFPLPCFSYGVEPVISPYYWRRTRAIDKGVYVYYFIIPNKVKTYVLSKLDKDSEDYKMLESFTGSVRDDDGKIGIALKKIIEAALPEGFFKPAHYIDPIQKIKLMGAIYKWVDAAVSCTYNLPRKANIDDVAAIYTNAFKYGVRAVSVYVDGSREGILIFEDPKTTEANNANKSNICDDRPLSIVPNCAPKRPKELPCDIIFTSIKGEKWTVLVGLFDGQPYEIFCGSSEDLYLPKSCKAGIIRKQGGGKYELEVTIRRAKVIYKDLADMLMNDEQKTITRILSLSMRHGILPRYIVEQLKKANGNITAFSTAVSRVLSRYIGTYALTGSDNKCPKCGEESMIFSEGCVKCINENCGYSRCG